MRQVPELHGRWNHNTHYYALMLAVVPHLCDRALDIGCGDGLLLRLLSTRCHHVVGIEKSPEQAELARRHCADRPNVEVITGDVTTHPFEPGSFDLVTAHASLHHLDTVPALRQMVELLRPGGVLHVVGLANNSSPLDWLVSAAGVPAHRLIAARRGYWQHTAPLADPTMSWAEVRSAANSELPGARWRRHLLWRYSLTWTKPAPA